MSEYISKESIVTLLEQYGYIDWVCVDAEVEPKGEKGGTNGT